MLGWYFKKRREKNERRLAEMERRAKEHREAQLEAVSKALKWHPRNQLVQKKEKPEPPFYLHKAKD